MIWITQKIIDECLKAEQDWLQRLPEIVSRANKATEKWHEEREQRERWKELAV
jgi:hypothetical protein